MNIDIHTLAIFMSITNFLQVIALFMQYRLNKTHQGLGWWAVGMTTLALGFVFNSLRDHPSLGLAAIVANNALFVSGLALLYTGILHFFGRRERRSWLIFSCALTTLLITYFTYISADLAARRVIFSLAVAGFAFLSSRELFVYRMEAVTASAHFLATLFAALGVFFVVRGFSPFFAGPVGDLFSATLTQIATYLVMLAATTLWTFGLILMVNQRLHEESRETQEYFEAFFKTSPDMVLITRLSDDLMVEINDGFSRATGYTRAEILGKAAQRIQLWKDPAVRQKMVGVLQEKGLCDNFEASLLHKDGSELTGLVSARLFHLRRKPYLVNVIRDVTARQQTEAAMWESEEKYRILFRDSPDAYLILMEGIFVDCNRATEVLLQGERSQIIGQTPAAFSPEFQFNGQKSAEAAAEKIRYALENGSNTFEWIHRRLNGEDFFVEVTVSAMQLSGKPALFTTWRDITERKHAEAAVRQSEQRYRQLAEKNTDIIWKLGAEIIERERAETALRENEQRYRLLAENTTDVIWLLDPERMKLLYISPSVEPLLEYTSAEVIALPFTDILAPETRAAFLQNTQQRVEEFLKAPQATAGYRDELLHLRKDGSTVWTETVNNYYFHQGSDQVEIQGVSRDITLRKHLENELQQQATTDELTRVFNRRHFLSVAQTEQRRAARLKHPFAIALIDLDHFKQINDTYGHHMGDQVLIDFTNRCRKNIREIDVFARFGGDEFALLLPETTCEQARQVVDRVHKAVTAQPFEIAGRAILVTMTAGVACSDAGSEPLAELLIRADVALYQAKEAGRNRIAIEPITPPAY